MCAAPSTIPPAGPKRRWPCSNALASCWWKKIPNISGWYGCSIRSGWYTRRPPIFTLLGNSTAAHWELKRRRGDKAGEAVSNGQLGRLCLDWGLFGAARGSFLADLNLSREIGDERGRAQMHNELAAWRLPRANSRKRRNGWTEHCATASTHTAGRSAKAGRCSLVLPIRTGPWSTFAEESEAALAAAETHLDQAGQLFASLGERFAEELAHAGRARGILARRRGDFIAANEELREALRHFRDHEEEAEIVRTPLEIDRNERPGAGAAAR
jgi:hypothetical protein